MHTLIVTHTHIHTYTTSLKRSDTRLCVYLCGSLLEYTINYMITEAFTDKYRINEEIN